MRLVAFSVTDFRSIRSSSRLAFEGNTAVLVGPNNEGKSNILRALRVALGLLQEMAGAGFRLRSSSAYTLRGRIEGVRYDWESDYPIGLQQQNAEGMSIFEVELQLTPSEVEDFYRKVGSRLNGELPLKLSIGQDGEVRFEVLRKRGPGKAALQGKAREIANFVGQRLTLQYIPAVRGTDIIDPVLRDMVAGELRSLRRDKRYVEAVRQIRELERPVLKRLSTRLTGSLKAFLPEIREVKIKSQPVMARSRDIGIVVDDGVATELRAKGDGIISLAAISLMHHVAAPHEEGRSLILAVEEPETHLHADSAHKLRRALLRLAETHQVLLTTHSPVFVTRSSPSANLIVRNQTARPAQDLEEIRRVLGVRRGDNLRSADLLIVVEGPTDSDVLRKVLQESSTRLKAALESGVLGFVVLHGCKKLTYQLRLLESDVVSYFCVLDGDAEGKAAVKAAIEAGLVDQTTDVAYFSERGQRQSELEDLLDVSLYDQYLQSRFKFDVVSTPEFKNKALGKWSVRLGAALEANGRPWDRDIEDEIKVSVAELAVKKGLGSFRPASSALLANLAASIDASLPK